MSWGIYVLRVIVQGVRDRGVNVLRGKCPGVSVQGVGDQGVLGVSVGGLHVRGGVLSCHPLHTHWFTQT